MQEQADANNSTKYLYMKLTYMDERGNEIQPGSNKATVYLPYPAGTSYESHKDVAFTALSLQRTRTIRLKRG